MIPGVPEEGFCQLPKQPEQGQEEDHANLYRW